MNKETQVCKLLESKYGWNLFNSLTTEGKRLVSDTIKAMREIELDYRNTNEGKRRFKNPRIYRITNLWQSFLWYIGIAWHNSYSDECTKDFNCCTPSIGKKSFIHIKKA